MQPAKARASLPLCTVLQEPSVFANSKGNQAKVFFLRDLLLYFQPHKKFWDMGGGDGKQDQTQGMFQNSPWNRPRDDGWSGGSAQGGTQNLKRYS